MDESHWFFDEPAHAGSEHLDPAYVAAYDRKAGVDPAEDIELLRSSGWIPRPLWSISGRVAGASRWLLLPSAGAWSRLTCRNRCWLFFKNG